MDKNKNLKVFISYSWTNREHEEWVLNLATRMMNDGIDTKLDKWDLKEGNDKYAFMESMVTDETIGKVLVVCEKGYKEKADNRQGGAGTETQIIAPEMYNKAKQEKFIPIIRETGDDFEEFMPTYMKGRIAIDLSSSIVFEEGYEKLLRLIADQPLYRKPELGKLPSYIFTESKQNYKTRHIVNQLKENVLKYPNRIGYYFKDFTDEFKKELNSFKIINEEFIQPFDEKVYDACKNLIELRNDYISFIDCVVKYREKLDIEDIKKLLEATYSFTERSDGETSSLQNDHYRFFLREIFLYTISILLENEEFEKIGYLTSTRYYVKKWGYSNREPVEFDKFDFQIQSLDEHRRNRLQNRLYSNVTDFSLNNSVVNEKNYRELLIESDFLLYYISKSKKREKRFSKWFARSYIYSPTMKILVLQKMESQRHFEKAKVLFEITKKEEMVRIIEEFPSNRVAYPEAFDSIPMLGYHVNVEDLCKYK